MDFSEPAFRLEVIEGGAAIRATPQLSTSTAELKKAIARWTGMDQKWYYLTQNGKRIGSSDANILANSAPFILVPRVLGGIGGGGTFTLLRSIRKHIEKPTDRDTSRDLSRQMHRDINEEQRLKVWIIKQAETAELRKKELALMQEVCDGPPLPKTEGQQYDQQWADMAESVFDEVERGIAAWIAFSSSNTSASTCCFDEDQGDLPQPSSSCPKNSGVMEEVEEKLQSTDKEAKKKAERTIKNLRRTCTLT